MEIKLWRAVVQYFAPIFPADERGRVGRGRGELRGGMRADVEESRGENGGGEGAQAAITKRQETIIIAP